MGARTKEKDNQFPAIKIKLRKWLLAFFNNPSVLDIYGGNGLMYKFVWKNNSEKYIAVDCDAIEWLNKNTCNFDIFDVDPYSSPYEAIEVIGRKTQKEVFGLVCTDGMLRRQAKMRGSMSNFLQKKMNWPRKDNDLFARIFYNYPGYLRLVLKELCQNYTVEKLAVKYGFGSSCDTCYFAALLKRK